MNKSHPFHSSFTKLSRTRIFYLFFLMLLFCSLPAQATDYGLFIEIESEEDLIDLLSAQDIDESTYQSLLELFEDGIDLNTASRDEIYELPNLTYSEVDAILQYRQEAGSITDPYSILSLNLISEQKFLAIIPFLIVYDVEVSEFPTNGVIKYRVNAVLSDEKVPSMWLGGEISTLKYIDAGIIGGLTRTHISDVRADNARDALTTQEPSVQVEPAKFYVQFKSRQFHLIAGTFSIGFGQKLVFDTTSKYNPNGMAIDKNIGLSSELSNTCKESGGELDSPCSGDKRYQYQAPDYYWTNRLRGLGVGLKRLEIGKGWFQAYAFGSYQTHDIYQYELYNKDRCQNPDYDHLDDCSAPKVYLTLDDPLKPTTQLKSTTLRNMFNELLIGGNASYFFGHNTHLGVTGYGAAVTWLVDDINLDFQEWSSRPYGGSYGAIGLDGSWGSEYINIFFELAKSFDGQPNGGGIAGIIRTTLNLHHHEIEAALRYYDQNFANPHAHPISASDEYEGLRARDEAGARLKYSGMVGDLGIRGSLDFWRQFSNEINKIKFYVRGEYEVSRWLKPGVWFEFNDKDISDSNRTNCYETYSGTPLEGEPEYCQGEKIKVGIQFRFTPSKKIGVTLKYQHGWLDDSSDDFSDSFRQDQSAWFDFAFKPLDDLRLRATFRYTFDDISSNENLEKSIYASGEVAYNFQKMMLIKLRYRMDNQIDKREGTTIRTPNPSHWLFLDLEYRF